MSDVTGSFPLGSISATASSEVISKMAFCINLAAVGKPITMYQNFDFDSLGVMDGVGYGTLSDGVYTLFDSTTDNSGYIEARLEIYTDLGALGQKKIRAVRIMGISSGQLEVVTVNDDGDSRGYVVTPDFLCDRHDFKVIVGKDEKGAYWRISVQNVAGASFSIDKLFAVYVRHQA